MSLTGNPIQDTYKDLLQVSNSNSGIDATLRPIEDGEGTASTLSLSTTEVSIAGDLTVDTTTLKVDSTNNYVGIGLASPGEALHVNGRISIGSDNDKFKLSDETSYRQIQTYGGAALSINPLGNDVGIGTSSPASTLHVYENSSSVDATAGLTIEQDGAGDAVCQFLLTGGQRWVMGIDNSNADRLTVAYSEDLSSDSVMTFKTNGYVGLGVDNPLDAIHIVNSTARIRISDSADTDSFVQIEDLDSNVARFSKTTNSGASEIQINPEADDNTSTSTIGLFRLTNTTGTKRVRFHVGDGTVAVTHQIAVDDDDSYFYTDLLYMDQSTATIGVGTDAPLSLLHVHESDSGASVASDTQLTVEHATGAAISIITNNTGVGRVVFGDNNQNNVGRIEYVHASDANAMKFYTAGALHLEIDVSGSVVCGAQSALATNATRGFIYIPTSAGAPTGTPTSFTGKVAMEYDTTNNDLYVYNGSWKSVTLS